MAGERGSGIGIRGYEKDDAPRIARLFHETVHSVNRADYSAEQAWAWSPEVPDPESWHARMSSRCTLVAERRNEKGDEVIAFAELEENGHLDMFYCRRDSVGRGVGSRLYASVEREARERGLHLIFTEASITARPFFERHGFSTLEERVVVRRGVELTSFRMQKPLGFRGGVAL
ncbi:GNAT family N-acetyltransferase [Rubrobacter aplysinae]|uniref:GNAT family N-acetyltransferase n=1 Tax=Rubrobacter aplysinae TaxID=909625 RepID=UPI00069EE088|nr:GNAT family N-acetyltransferase [Rubrobacter aplysinae]